MSRLAGWIASSVAWLLVCSPGLAAQSPLSTADAAGPFTAWARHAWQPSEGMPDGPITAIVPLVDGSLLVAGKTGRCCLDGDRVRPLAAADPQFAKLDPVPLDPWLAAGRAAASPCTLIPAALVSPLTTRTDALPASPDRASSALRSRVIAAMAASVIGGSASISPQPCGDFWPLPDGSSTLIVVFLRCRLPRRKG
jgi:hypothetical protein